MLNRKVSLVAGVCLASGVAAFGQVGPGSGLLFFHPGAASSNSRFVAYNSVSNNLNLLTDRTGPAGAYQVLAKPDGTKFYALGVGAGALQVIDSAFTSFHQVNGLPTVPTAMAISPDGTYLATGGFELNIVDTATDQVLGSNLPLPGAVISIALSRDSTIAYVLTTSAFGSQLTAYNVISRTRIANQLNLFGGATGVTISPLSGLVYVTGQNRIYEINPTTLTITQGGELALAGALGPLKFTPDGLTAYCVNSTPSIGGSILQFTPANKGVSSWPPFPQNPPVFTDVLIAGNGRIFAISGSSTTLWDVTPAPFGASQSALNALIPVNAVLAAAVSNEVPTSQYLFALVGNSFNSTIYRIDLTTNTVSLQVLSTFSTNSTSFVGVPNQAGTASSFYLLNNFQIIQPGATSQPFYARILDASSHPVFNQPVTFTVQDPNSLIVFNGGTSKVSDGDGYVQTSITAPTAPGSYVFQMTAGSAVGTVTFTVPGTPPPGGGGGGGGGNPGNNNPQVQKISGDGQLIDSFSFSTFNHPLTVRVTDTAGNPLANVPVTFTLTSGNGTVNIFCGVGGTDVNGIAACSFSFGEPPTGLTFQTNIITASTQFGSVDFYVTNYHLNNDFSGAPDFLPTFGFVNTNGRTVTRVSGAAFDASWVGNEMGIGPPTSQSSYIIASVADHDHLTLTQSTNPALQTGADFSMIASAVTVTGAAGSLVQDAITYKIDTGSVFNGHNAGTPIPYIGMRIGDERDSSKPGPAACEGLTISDNNGISHCNLRMGCKVGPRQGMTVIVGEYKVFSGFVIITPGGADNIAPNLGNGQAGRAGQLLTVPLSAIVNSACGQTAIGAQVVWGINSGSATLEQTVSVSNNSGLVSTQVRMGQQPGPVQVQATLANGAKVVFDLTNSVVVGTLLPVSGGGQTAFANQSFTDPVVFAVQDVNNKPVVGADVLFTVSPADASANPATAKTDINGRVSTNIAAGSTTGQITVTASYAGFTGSVTLTAKPPGPSVTAASFTNAYSKVLGLVPCGLATVTATGLLPGTQGTVSGGPSNGPYQFTVAGLSISINNVNAPILSATNSNGQQFATFQTPCETQPGSATVVVSASGSTSTVNGVQVLAAQPGMQLLTGYTKNYGVVISGRDGSFVSPVNYLRRCAAAVCAANESYFLIVTGLGQTTPTLTTNFAGGSQNVNASMIVGVNNSGVQVGKVQSLAGQIGLYSVEFWVPQSAAQGADQALAVASTLNGQTTFAVSANLAGVQ